MLKHNQNHLFTFVHLAVITAVTAAKQEGEELM